MPDIDQDGRNEKVEKNVVNNGFPVIEGIEVNLNDGKKHDVLHLNKGQHEDIVNNNSPLKKENEVVYPILNWRKIGNYEEQNLPTRTGPGEYGAKVTALPSEKEAVASAIKEFGFNMVNSDKISLDRLPKDLRHQE